MNAIVKIMTMVVVTVIIAVAGMYLMMRYTADVYWLPVLLGLMFTGGLFGLSRVLLALWLDHENLRPGATIATLVASVAGMLIGVRVFYIDAFFNPTNTAIGAGLLVLPLLTLLLVYSVKQELTKMADGSQSELLDQTTGADSG